MRPIETRSWTYAAVAALALAGCGKDAGLDVEQKQGEIINGWLPTSANPPENPGTVAVYHKFARPCSGTLIRKRWVLTARHCLNSDPFNSASPLLSPSQVSVVRALSPGLQPPAGAITAARLIVHPSLDAALVRLSSDISFPVAFYDGDGPELVNKLVRAMGFGRNVDGGNETVETGTSGAGTLRAADIPVTGMQANTTFVPWFPSAYDVASNGQGQITWHGDSGGPDYAYGDRLGRQAPGVVGIHRSSNGAFAADAVNVPAIRNFLKTQMYNPGDTDFDHRADIIMTGGNWTTIPIARSNGDGTFTLQNPTVADFPGFATAPNVTALSGDFDGDGTADVALTGPVGWESVPIALGMGAGSVSFRVKNVIGGAGNIPTLARTAGAQVVAGDFNGDGRSDIAVAGVPGSAVTLAFSIGDGTFQIFDTSGNAGPDFPAWARTAGVRLIAGDFDGDGRDDLALTGPVGWETIPVAFSAGDGTFLVTNKGVLNFPSWARTSGVKMACGDFNADGRDDIVAMGGAGWTDIRFAIAKGDGSFIPSSGTAAGTDFAKWAATSGARVKAIDVNGDGNTDVALVGGAGWGSIPVLLNTGNGVFKSQPVNVYTPDVAALASTANVKIVAGH